jgi:hypothetical protein
LALCWGTAAFAANNPNGFIRGPGWNFLLLQSSFGGNGGGPDNMNLNWIAPHEIGIENPKAGDVYAGLTFGGDGVTTARATGWSGAATIAADPVWFTVSDTGVLNVPGSAAEVIDGINLPTNDTVDFQHVVDRINAVVAATPDFAGDNAISIATTYVRNTTAGNLDIQIGSTSDDGCQTWLNDRRLLTRSDGRGVRGDFEEVASATLPPGISKISALVFEGGGGWGMRIGVIHRGIRLDDVTGPAVGIEFIGNGAGDPMIVGQVQGADPVMRTHCPQGWIVTRAWNLLGPLDNPYSGEAGNIQNHLGNWLHPYDLRIEDPKPGDIWDIDFTRALTTGYAGRGFQEALKLGPNPIWHTFDDLQDIATAAGIGALPGTGVGIDPFGRGLVDYEDIIRALSARLKPLGVPTIDGRNCPDPANYNTDCDPDLLFLAATTYVRNKTGADLPVRIVTASDDGIQVWVNCQLTTMHSLGRGSDRVPTDYRPAVLPPGISKIAVFVFEGGGGFNFRLGIQPVNSPYNYADGSPEVEFLGTGEDDDSIVGVEQFCMERSFDSPVECDTSKKVVIQGNGNGTAGQEITVVEHLNAYNLDDITVTDISGGGTLETDVVENVYTNVASTGQDIWQNCDAFQFDYSLVSGDFDIAVEILSRGHSTGSGRSGKSGLMVRLDLAPNSFMQIIQDLMPELLDNMRVTQRLTATGTDGCDATAEVGGSGGTILHPRFMRVTRRGQVVATYAAADLRLQDGALDPLNDANWSRRTNQDFAGALPADLYVGFANSEHGSRGLARQRYVYRILPSSTVPAWTTFGIVGTDPGGDSSTTFGNATIGKRIRWNTTVGEVNTNGLSYTVTNTNPGVSQHLEYLPARRVDTRPTAIEQILAAPYFDFQGQPVPPQNIFTFQHEKVLLSGTTAGSQISPKLYQYEKGNDSGTLSFPLGTVIGPLGDFEQGHDIGTEYDPITPGTATYDGTTYRVSGNGSDVWDGGDHMYFLYKKVTGDFVATTRIANIPNPPNTRWGRSGIMARYSVHDSAKYSLACVAFRGESPDLSDTKRHQSRRDFHESFGMNTVRDGTGNTNREQQVVPAGHVSQSYRGWVRLVRKGNAFYSLFADDVEGSPGPWALAGSDHHANPPDTLLLGLVSSAHGSAGANLMHVDYDNWSVRELSTVPDDCKVVSQLVSIDFSAPLADYGAVVAGGAAFAPATIDGRLRVTQDGIGNIANAIWFDTTGVPLGNSGFIAEFDVYYSKAAGADPADGMTFAVVEGPFTVATGLVGGGGGEMGYNRGDHNAIPAARPKSFAVEFDNWDGGHGDNDPRGQGAGGSNQDDRYHMAIDVNFENQSSVNNVEWGAEVPPYYHQPPFHNRPMGIHAEVEYNPADSTGTGVANLRVFVTANDGSFPRTQVLGGVVPKMTSVFIGFTGATGGATSTQEVDNLKITRLCCENVDAVEITGPTEIAEGETAVLTAAPAGTDASGTAAYSWSIVSGPGMIVGPSNGETVEVACTEAGAPVEVEVTLGDGVCMDMASATHTVTCVCPEEGDTHCTDIEIVSAPDGNGPGSYTFKATAVDDSGQAVIYSFSVDDVVVQTGPGDTLVTDLEEGDHTIGVTVDDDPDCEDVAGDSACTPRMITVLPAGGFQLPGDCNQDAMLNVSDPICLLNYLFGGDMGVAELACGEPGGTEPDPADIVLMDANGDGRANISDAVSSLLYQFGSCGAGPPCPPHVLGTECVRIAGCPDNTSCP